MENLVMSTAAPSACPEVRDGHIPGSLCVWTFLKAKVYFFFFMRTLAYAHSRTRSLAKYTSFDSYAYTDIRRMCFASNCNTSPGLAGPVRSGFEDYSVAKDTE